jgi:hypothetical protein
LKNITLCVCIFLVLLVSPKTYEISPAKADTAKIVSERSAGQISQIKGIPERYSPVEIDQMLAGTENPGILRQLIQCESQNTNIARIDSNGLMSYGILQFNGTATWSTFAPLAGVSSSAMNPIAAIRVADWMVSHGFLSRWSCARILHLL